MGNHLYQALAPKIEQWAKADYPCDFPAISEIFDWSQETENGTFRFLRKPQFEALKTYWYLRLVESTPKTIDLYDSLFAKKRTALLDALDLARDEIKNIVVDEGLEALWERVKTDDDFVRNYRMEALRETLTLDYPSYILALAMGAGKTILIGAIIAIEFAMAMEYPDGPFVQNALVFAPGKTIIESLRELLGIPYEKLLPPRMYKPFAASFKPIFTRDGEKDIPAIRGSLFNVIVTNTEKIRIQKETIRTKDVSTLFGKTDEAAQIANLRLQTIASLPHLSVFSDEAHHTYGQSLGAELKRVRQTVDYLHQNSPNLICVVNTTGTPYFQRQPLKDIVYWYGLSQGIRDGILKDVADNIREFEVNGQAQKFVRRVVTDFFKDYGDVCLPNGAAAKLAIYFPQTKDLKQLRPVIDKTLVEIGHSPALCLVNTSDEHLTKQADIDAFNRLNDPNAPHRVILLVNKGTEGWNCPSLFACALARQLKRSNNFVLQAATRCLRQVPGNVTKARVYLSLENFRTLDSQLQETYGESLQDLNHAAGETRSATVVLRKLDVPPLVITQTVRTVVRLPAVSKSLTLSRPTNAGRKATERTFTIQAQTTSKQILVPIGAAVEIEGDDSDIDPYAAACDLAACYRLDAWTVYDEIRRLYGKADVPVEHIPELRREIESHFSRYEIREEKVDVALALVKADGWEREFDTQSGTDIYTAEIRYPKHREHLLLSMSKLKDQNPNKLSFHYDPYNFSSKPEMSFLEQLLSQLKLDSGQVEDIYFTGAIRDKQKTDFYIEYKDTKGKSRTYIPDFVVRLKPEAGKKCGSGKVLIVEIKAENDRADEIDGENGKKAVAVRRWEKLNPERLKYHIIFTSTDSVTYDQVEEFREMAARMYR